MDNFGRTALATISDEINGVSYDSDFRMNFNIQRNNDASKPDVCVLKIYNPIDQITFYMDETFLTLEAGYQENNGTIFKGNISSIQWGREGNDVVITITAGDGEVAVKQLVAIAHPPQTSLDAIVKNELDTMSEVGLSIASGAKSLIKTALSGKKVNIGTLINGKAIDALKKSLRMEGYTVTIADNTLYVRELFKATEEDAILLTPDTGLLDTPALITKNFSTGKGKAKRKIEKKAVKFQCQIMAGIHPGREIKIESEFIEGYFVVDNMAISGDTSADGDWKISGEAIML